MSNKKNEYDMDQVTLDLDDGTELTCDVLAIFPVNINNNEQMYIALIDENATEDSDIFLYRAIIEGEDIDLEEIEDDEEFEAVEDAFDELLDEAEFDEMFGEDD